MISKDLIKNNDLMISKDLIKNKDLMKNKYLNRKHMNKQSNLIIQFIHNHFNDDD